MKILIHRTQNDDVYNLENKQYHLKTMVYYLNRSVTIVFSSHVVDNIYRTFMKNKLNKSLNREQIFFISMYQIEVRIHPYLCIPR